jgi:hypothetical protein
LSDWLCQDCKSVNSSGARNCYRCWTPRKFGEAPDPATLPPGVTVEEAHEERKRQLRPSASDARSSRRRSWVVLACITVTVAFSALSLAFVGAKGGSLGVAFSLLSGDWTVMGSLLAISLVGGVLALASMIAWFVWFDRVLANVPALTGTWPEVSRVMAVAWWLVPIVGQLKGTFVVGHVYGLMTVASSPGVWLLGLWGITWIGGTLAPSVAGFVVGWLPLPLEESVHLQDLISNLGQISYIAAGFFAAALILTLEHARDVRMSGQASGADAEPEVALEDRLAGRTTPVASLAPGSGFPASWHTGLDPAHDAPDPWSGSARPWPTASTYSPGGAHDAAAPAEDAGWPDESAVSPGWPRPPGASTAWPSDPATSTAWPSTPTTSAGWPSGPAAGTGWPSAPADATAPGGPTWPAPPPIDARAAAEPPAPPTEPGDRSRKRRRSAADRGPVPFEPILLMGALVLAGVVAGITMAGMYDPFGTLGRVAGGQAVGGATPTPTGSSSGSPLATAGAAPSGPAASSGPTATSGPAASPAPVSTRTPATSAPVGTVAPATTVPGPTDAALPTVVPTTPAGPTPTPSPTPVPADLVARRLVRIVTADDYRGVMNIDATLTDANGDTTWTAKVGRAGQREYRLQTIQRPGADPDVLERAALVSSVWERDATSDWEQRRKTDRDRATPPLFDLTDAAQLTPDGQVVEDGETLYRFRWDAPDARIQQFVRDMGSVQGLRLRSGELLATADGLPVRLELRLGRSASGVDEALRMTIGYSEVGSTIEIRSPRVGPPLVVVRR